ncbi:MAG: hypothetical protein ACJ0RH_03105, partial [Gammaproteobacteria bacterium]
KKGFLVEQFSSISYPNLIMTNIFNNLSEIIGVFSAFIVFFCSEKYWDFSIFGISTLYAIRMGDCYFLQK